MSRFWVKEQNTSIAQSFRLNVTLLIPFRNEKENIPSLILNLKKLRYPQLEILLVDDHSEDGSLQLLKEGLGELWYVKILESPAFGKKKAVEYGVKMASGEIILCSDADCFFPELWIERMVSPFQDTKIHLVAAAVMVEDKGRFLDIFQSLDWAGILLITSYSFSKNKPLMCSGANLAYRKEAFEKVCGYEGNHEFASGDDEFLLKKIHKFYGQGATGYLSSSESLVKTNPELTWRDLINQRIRWAGKWKAHFSLSHAISALGAFIVQLIWIGSFSLIFLGGKGILTFGVVWLLKGVAEKISLGGILEVLGCKQNNISILKTSLVHPFYVLWVGIRTLDGKFTWKGREN